MSLLECGAAVAQVTVNHLVVGSNPTIPANIRGVAQPGLERLLWEQEAQGSNPCVPTKLNIRVV